MNELDPDLVDGLERHGIRVPPSLRLHPGERVQFATAKRAETRQAASGRIRRYFDAQLRVR